MRGGERERRGRRKGVEEGRDGERRRKGKGREEEWGERKERRGRGGEGNREEGRRDGRGGKRRGKRAPEKVHNMRKTTPVIGWLGLGMCMLQIFREAARKAPRPWRRH